MTTTYQDPEALAEFRAQQTSADIAAVRSAGFRLLLEEGRPLDADELADASGLDPDLVGEVLERIASHGRAEFDGDDRLTGIAGLTIEPTRHRLELNTATRWTWCALDAVGILGALEATGTITSIDPGTGQDIEISFSDGKPEGDAVLFILGGYDGDNVREDWCPMVNFFATTDDAEAWIAENQLRGDVVSVAQIAADASEMWRPVVATV